MEGYLRFPSVAGDLIAFAAEDDVWLARLDGPTTGGGWRAERLSADRAPVSDPRLSPDGTALAWVGRRDGAPDVYAADVGGGPAERLSWWGDAHLRVLGWQDDRVVAATAVDQPQRSRTWARAVPRDGGPATVLPYGPVTGVARGGSGPTVVSRGFGGRRRDYAWWKRYRGGTASQLWVSLDDRGDGAATFQRLRADLDGQLVHPMVVAGRVAFLSDHEGHGNVYSVLPDGSDLRRHTDHDRFWARQATTDGQRVVYASGGDLWLLEDLSAASRPRRLEVTTGGPRSVTVPQPVPAARHVDDIAPDRTARTVALGVRGGVHVVATEDGPARTVPTAPGGRARLLRAVGEGDTLVLAWVDDGEGEDAVAVLGAGEDAPRRHAAGHLGRVLDLALSPDGRTVAVGTHDGRLVVVDATRDQGGGTDGGDGWRVLDRTSDDGPTSLAFSPCSGWLTWCAPGPEPLSQVRLARLRDDLVVEVTPMRFTDTDPVFTTDGRHLAFLSRRTFDPVYDDIVFGMAFTGGVRPYLVPLSAATPSPFEPRAGGRPPAPPRGDGANDAGGDFGDGGNGGDGGDPPATEVDVEALPERVVPVPVPTGRYRDLRAVAGGLVWRREPALGELGEQLARPSGQPPRHSLERVDLTTGEVVELAAAVDAVAVSGDGRRLVLRDQETVLSVPSDRRTSAEDTSPVRVEVHLGRVRATVVPRTEWRQMYEETGRLMRDHFWAPDMAGVDWVEVLRRYRPLLERLGSRDDLSDLLWEVVGELGTSHAYEVPPERPLEDALRLGRLGADLERGDDGRWRVAEVLPGETSVGRARSPLRAPGAGVGPGEVLLAVDGRPVDGRGPGPLLVGAAGTPVELDVTREGSDPGPGTVRRVVVVPLDDEAPLRYQAWVAARRREVHEVTDGRVGYLHVPDMMAEGWAQLHRDLRVEVQRDAVLLDVRGNGGGHVSQLVVERLARTVLGWQVGRGWQPFSYPSHARRGPLVCLSDENAGSDGDIVTQVVRLRGLGPVVGTRTWGGVVGIDGRYTLVDGTGVTQPRYATWFDGPGWDVENHGVDPDVEVVITPQDWAAGRDPQLDTAVRLVLEALEQHRPVLPADVSTRPSRVPPPLPPRP